MANPQADSEMKSEYNQLTQDGASLLIQEQTLSRQFQTEITSRTVDGPIYRIGQEQSMKNLKSNSLEKLNLVYGKREASASIERSHNSSRTNQPQNRLRDVHLERNQIQNDAELIKNRVNQL